MLTFIASGWTRLRSGICRKRTARLLVSACWVLTMTLSGCFRSDPPDDDCEGSGADGQGVSYSFCGMGSGGFIRVDDSCDVSGADEQGVSLCDAMGNGGLPSSGGSTAAASSGGAPASSGGDDGGGAPGLGGEGGWGGSE